MDPRLPLIEQVERHQPFDEQEARAKEEILTFLRAHEDCFERSLLIGHVTGGGWVVDRARELTLLTHHAKLDKWLQLGGHADGDPDVLRVALREVKEESGLARVAPLIGGAIFDVDTHLIPARRQTPQHVHYDIRFLFEASPEDPVSVTPESKDVQWIRLDQVASLNTDASVLRMVARTFALRSRPLRTVESDISPV